MIQNIQTHFLKNFLFCVVLAADERYNKKRLQNFCILQDLHFPTSTRQLLVTDLSIWANIFTQRQQHVVEELLLAGATTHATQSRNARIRACHASRASRGFARGTSVR